MRDNSCVVDFLRGEVVKAALCKVASALAQGRLPALPIGSYPLGSVASAMRCLATGQHVGKVVVQSLPSAVSHPAHPDGLVAVSGGLGALGVVVAMCA